MAEFEEQKQLIPEGWMIEIQKLITAVNQQQQHLIVLNQHLQQQIEQQNKKLISEEWSAEVRNFLEATLEGVPVNRCSVRLSRAVMSAKPEAYAPQMVSLGPYHHFSLRDESVGPFHKRLTHLSQMEVYKLRSTREVARNDPLLIQKMFARVSESDMMFEFQQFYDWEINKEDVLNFARMMMIDALFLSYFLKSGFDDDRQLGSSVTLGSGASKAIADSAKASIRCDIVKLENQIPLSLLRNLELTNSLDSLLPSQINRLSSFQVSDIEEQYYNEKHLLGCIHKYVSTFLQVSGVEQDSPPTCCQKISNVIGDVVAVVFSCCYTHPARSGRQDFLVKYSAKELQKFGIKFKEFKGPGKIRFCRNSDTLYLPQITISDPYTEVLLRNLLALEFNDAGREKHVTIYVELMDCLIDNPEDVALLRESHVIVRESMMITDEYVAKMWEEMSSSLELPGGLRAQIREVLFKNYYKKRLDFKGTIRRWWDEVCTNYLSSPWKIAALMVGVLMVVLTMVQTYCTV